MELSNKEMKSFIPFSGLGSKMLFYKKFFKLTNESKLDFQNRKWNYPNREWNHPKRKFNYFFLAFDQKAYFTTSTPY